MKRIYSNGGDRDFVRIPFDRLIAVSSQIYLAAPYFTQPDTIIEAARREKSIRLLVGLNAATSPKALNKVFGQRDIALR